MEGRPQLGRRDFFFRARFTFFHIFTLLLLLSSSVSLSYFLLAVPMRKRSGEHSCMSSTFHIAKWFCLFRNAKWSLIWPKLRMSKIKL